MFNITTTTNTNFIHCIPSDPMRPIKRDLNQLRASLLLLILFARMIFVSIKCTCTFTCLQIYIYEDENGITSNTIIKIILV